MSGTSSLNEGDEARPSDRSLLRRAEKLDDVSVRLGLTTSMKVMLDGATAHHHRRHSG
jgi:hypothetical protein